MHAIRSYFTIIETTEISHLALLSNGNYKCNIVVSDHLVGY